MNPLMIVTLIESVFAALEQLCAHLVSSGAIPADHPAVAQVAQTKLAVIDAKVASTAKP
jgi:predicted Rossmann-fold nucleotide-binding protein